MSDEPLSVAFVRATELRVREFDTQELVNTSWAFVRVDRSNELVVVVYYYY